MKHSQSKNCVWLCLGVELKKLGTPVGGFNREPKLFLGENTCCGGDSCCDTKPGGCLVGEGDCDNDSHCKGDLVCGKDNCGGVTGYDGLD